MTRLAVLVVSVLVAVAASITVAVVQLRDHREAFGSPPSVAVADRSAQAPASLGTGPRILFRHTGIDDQFGRVAAVPLDDPAGPRSFSESECERLDATPRVVSCLVTEAGVPTQFSSLLLDADGEKISSSPLPGVPSRTRLSPSGRSVATTAFVAGHSYMQSGFSTTTEIRSTDGADVIDLEDLELVLGGRVASPVDRNYWGVTFRDDQVFWATVATGGRTWLVQGDLEEGRLTALVENAECPSVSPDGTRVAYKVRVGDTTPPVWELEVRDLPSGATVRLGRTRGLDDQAEWLDDDTLLYGLARESDPGTTDVWAVDVRPEATPRLLIEQAWSPTVIPRSRS